MEQVSASDIGSKIIGSAESKTLGKKNSGVLGSTVCGGEMKAVASHLLRLLVAATTACAISYSIRAAEVIPKKTAPDFAVKSMSNKNIRLSEYRGDVVLVNFWATWCRPCRQEIPELNRLYEVYRKMGVQFLGVNIDENPASSIKMAKDFNIQYPVLLDSEQKVSKLFAVEAMPSTYLIDRDGNIRFYHVEYTTGADELYSNEIKQLLAE